MQETLALIKDDQLLLLYPRLSKAAYNQVKTIAQGNLSNPDVQAAKVSSVLTFNYWKAVFSSYNTICNKGYNRIESMKKYLKERKIHSTT